MKRTIAKCEARSAIFFLGLAFLLSGCVVRTYPLTRDRVDQDTSAGNRGYLQGSVPAKEPSEKKYTRTTQMIEIELRSPIKFEKLKKSPSEKAPEAKIEEPGAFVEGNRGYITRSATAPEANFEKYTVQKNDTLQKISKKFYGTTKKWKQIFEANQDVLKAPNKVYPGQVLNIPVEGLLAPKENLK